MTRYLDKVSVLFNLILLYNKIVVSNVIVDAYFLVFTQHDDGPAPFEPNEAFEHGSQDSHANLEDLCRSHLVSFDFPELASVYHNSRFSGCVRLFTKGTEPV